MQTTPDTAAQKERVTDTFGEIARGRGNNIALCEEGDKKLAPELAAELRQVRSVLLLELIPVFHWPIFFFQLGTHLLYPFSLLFFLPIRGWLAAQNQQLVHEPRQGQRGRAYLLNNTIDGVLLVGIFAVLWGSDLRASDWVWPGAVLTLVLQTMRYIVVAVKWGYLTAKEINHVRSLDFVHSQEVQGMMQIITSFTQIKTAFYIAELERVAHHMKACGMDTSATKFRLTAAAQRLVRLKIRRDLRRLREDARWEAPLTAHLSADFDKVPPARLELART
jgi:hypothetical protein